MAPAFYDFGIAVSESHRLRQKLRQPCIHTGYDDKLFGNFVVW